MKKETKKSSGKVTAQYKSTIATGRITAETDEAEPKT